MPKGMKKGQTNGGSFQPGNKMAALRDFGLVAMRKATKTQLFKAFSSYASMDIESLQKLYADPSLTALDGGIIKSLMNFKLSGDYDDVKWPLEQMIGKAKESFEIGVTEDDGSNELLKLLLSIDSDDIKKILTEK